MNIKIDWDKVVDIQGNAEGDGYYTISVLFDNGQALTYGYTDQKEFMKDYTDVNYGRL